MTKRSGKRRLSGASECAMAVVHWEEKHEEAARAFADKPNDLTRKELRVAAYGVWHWHRELNKAKKRERLS